MRNKKGSALIMAVAIVSMLAMVGAMFLLVSKTEEAATVSIHDFKTLDNAVSSVISKIADELRQDTPGVTTNSEYCDYPDDNDKWLAAIKPFDDSGVYKWQQITDLFDDFNNVERQNVSYSIINENTPAVDKGDADADGDGVSDAKWVELKNVHTTKGEPLYAAVRIIDNSAMINVNTAYKFDPDSTNRDDIDGRYLTQIDLEELFRADEDANVTAEYLQKARVVDANLTTLTQFRIDTLFKFKFNSTDYNLFDISDELELRNRFLLSQEKFESRLGHTLPRTVPNIKLYKARFVPFDSYSEWQDKLWLTSAADNEKDRRHLLTTYNADRTIDPAGGQALMVNFDYNEPNITTVYNSLVSYFDAEETAGNMTHTDNISYKRLHAQILANLKDFCDRDANSTETDTPIVTVFENSALPSEEFYGWERPFVFVSELARAFQWDNPADTNDPNTMHRSYGIEIYKRPRTETFNLANKNDFRLRIINPNYTITVDSENFEDRGGRFYVQIFDDKDANAIQLEGEVEYSDSPWNGATGVDPNVILSWEPYRNADPNWGYDFYIGKDANSVKDANNTNHPGTTYQSKNYNNRIYKPTPAFDANTTYYWRVDDVNGGGEVIRTGDVWKFTTWINEPNDVNTIRTLGDPAVFDKNSQIVLERWVEGKTIGSDKWLEVDRIDCNDINSPFFDDTNGIVSYRRNLKYYKVLKRIWEVQNDDSLGNYGGHFFSDGGDPIPLYGSESLVNIGELGFIYDVDVYSWDTVNYSSEEDVMTDLTDPNVNILFNYLTRIFSNDEYYRIQGRININTAAAEVISKLPWMFKRESAAGYTTDPNALAKAIVAYRDKLDLSSDGGPNYLDRTNATGLAHISEQKGFGNIGQLMCVINDSSLKDYDIRYYGLDSKDQVGFPDLHFDSRTGDDGITDGLEEEQLIFERISDLVTVRSDVFTAYILVRLGENGPQRRIIAVFDRSKVNNTPESGRVEVITRYAVPDPR